ncbi:hypothetical protein SRHO_G00058110 [Serrasalmus rhombeus]
MASSAVRRILADITRFSGRPGTSSVWSLRPCTVRALSVTSHCCAKSLKSPGENEDDLSKPIKFSTSKGSHRTWKVERSMGSTHQRPWWQVLPFSVLGVSFLLWCFFRKESEIDQALEKQLFEYLPGLLTFMEEEEEKEEQIEALKERGQRTK